MVKAVFLDRDGVINANIERDGRPVAPSSITEFRVLPGVVEAVAQLKAAGFLVIVVTNQPDVATGRTTRTMVEAMHEEIKRQVPVDAIKVCYHVDADQCSCRKPRPGMLMDAAGDYGIELQSSYMVGDRWRDTEAGRAVGCFTIFVDYGHEQEGPNRPDLIVSSLSEAVARILERQRVPTKGVGNVETDRRPT